MKKLALIAVSYLALGSAGAFAIAAPLACIESNLTSGSPSGTFETAGPGSTGTLDGFFTGTYHECTAPGGTLIAVSSSIVFTNAVIPFFETRSEAANVAISVAETEQPGATFDLFLDGSATPFATDVLSGADTEVEVPAGLNVLAITENYPVSTASALLADPIDQLSVGVSLVNFITPSTVPEPATLGLLGFGAACLAGLRRRRRRA